MADEGGNIINNICFGILEDHSDHFLPMPHINAILWNDEKSYIHLYVAKDKSNCKKIDSNLIASYRILKINFQTTEEVLFSIE